MKPRSIPRSRAVLWARLPSLARVGLVLLALVAGTGGARAAANFAVGKPVVASGPLWPGFGPENLTDGNPGTFTHPLADSATRGFFFQIDLGAPMAFERVVIRNRNDGCCPERLTRYRLEIYAAGGDDEEPGELNWTAPVRSDGSDSGSGGEDVITSINAPSGIFGGRFLRIVNDSDLPYSPQLAEVEVYGGALPEIRSFVADPDVVESGGPANLQWTVAGATGGRLDPGGLPVPLPTGAVTVNPTQTTTYTLTVSNAQGPVTATVRVAVGVALLPMEISEFQAGNDDLVRDEDGDRVDWIELHNPNEYSLRTSGLFLSDDPDDLRKWPLPDARVPAGAYRLVFASGKDRRVAAAEWHTNFRLDAGGETLLLSDSGGTRVLDRYPATGRVYPRQVDGASYGRGTNGAVGFLKPPTPRDANGEALEGIVAGLEASVAHGFHDEPFEVRLSNPTPGVVIRYTLDRTEPTAERGLVYSDPLQVARTTVLRAAAFRDRWAPSPVITHTYVFPTQVVAAAVMRKSVTTNALYAPQMRDALFDLPSLSLVSGTAIGDTTEVRASLEWIEPPGKPPGTVPAGFQANCGARRFGGAFTDFAKKSFRIYFRREYGAGRLRYPVFGAVGEASGIPPVEEFDQLELRSGSHDMEMRGFYMSNAYTDDTQLEMGQLAPHGRFVHLYLNGTYWGVYHLRERWGAAMHASYRGGDKSEFESINGNWNVGGWAEPGTAYDGDGTLWDRVKTLRSDYQGVRPWLDVAHYIDFMLLWMFGGSEDEYRCVGALTGGNGFQFFLNDADGWFCVPGYCAADDRTGRGAPGRQAGDGPGSLFSMLFKAGDPDYRVLLADRIHEALRPGGALSPERTAARLARRIAEFERPFLAESARWGYLTPAAWGSRRDSVRNSWLPSRSAEYLGQLRGAGFFPRLDAPRMTPSGGKIAPGETVRFSVSAGASVYYTTDGTDPRLPGGAVSPTARAYRAGGRVDSVIATGARWRWFTSATGLGASDVVEGRPEWSSLDWKHPAFDDRGWSEGPSELGYGDGDEATVIPFGGQASGKWTTSYFRREFDLASPGTVTALRLRLRRDDGAIVYLNGRECARSGLDAGRVTASTLAASASDDGATWLEFLVEPSGLFPAGNVIAVEVHQSSASSSDVSFDLELDAERAEGGSGDEPVLGVSTVVKCRAWQANAWSALETSSFQTTAEPVEVGEVVFSEIHFDPRGTDGTEFVELINRSAHAVNLRAARVAGGVDYLFPADRDVALAPGERCVLVRDPVRYRERYGFAAPIQGRYAGQLSNAGESLNLVSVSGRVIAAARYAPTAPWPGDAADGGRSLVFTGAATMQGDGGSWVPSAMEGGTPGVGEPVAPSELAAPGGERDEDADGLPRLVEMALASSDADPASGRDAIAYQVDASGRLILTVRRRLGLESLRLRAEVSSDLMVWTPLERAEIRADTGDLAHETWVVPPAATSAVMVRLTVVRDVAP